MYKKFKIDLNELTYIEENVSTSWEYLVSIGCSQFNNIKESVESDLTEFTNPDGSLQADDIVNYWFPSINADIFISHSHKDEEYVLGLAGWLKTHFGLNSFIDSAVWGYSDELLKKIDNKYCKSLNGNTYDYQKRNRSTSHVHMMLSTALMNMIDKCEVFMFVETQNSFTPSEYFSSDGETESPWIYSELSLVAKLQENIPERFKRNIPTCDSIEFSESLENLRIKYPANMSGLTTLTSDILVKWKNSSTRVLDKVRNLDNLYRLVRE
ncbi:toll/interleukin-1 receptor domain-containing protein [Rodentibacter sp. Ppn85]|uniref:toll/interleukin-1 receptor domain-containing protein n=1 Tax=Rodentibacter sp. Ppn85 TaxID=1908525 RepID=UPI0009CB1F49|nr:toll/interleukin-1 receptor domain-containing protein [Rodentibacter sp. Ppn85]OOF61552.1 hypothetical protein BKL51_10530 [Rodentibacter sp. Ppn85]